MIKLSPGRYKAEQDNGIFDRYRILIDFLAVEIKSFAELEM